MVGYARQVSYEGRCAGSGGPASPPSLRGAGRGGRVAGIVTPVVDQTCPLELGSDSFDLVVYEHAQRRFRNRVTAGACPAPPRTVHRLTKAAWQH
jgi:hypothetical protein